MDERQRERLLAALGIWQRLHKVNLKITDNTASIQGQYKRFTGKRKICLYLDNKQTYRFNTSDIIEIEFVKVIGLIYTVSMKDKADHEIFIEPVL